MSFFDTFMGFTLFEEIFSSLKDLATTPDTARWFWCITIGLIIVLSMGLLIVSAA